MSSGARPAFSGQGWSRRYPPLLAVIGALVLALFTLPSALNLPLANPGQTLEYAPVPGAGNAQAGGNFAGLGLGANLPVGPDALLGLLPGGAGGTGLPSAKRCVGNPPRQTEDPLSPPCVATYLGNNGGATWVGVTGSEFIVVFHYTALSANCYPVSEPANCGPTTGLYDMDKASDVSQFFEWRFLHDWEVYFNSRYQTYNRRAHFYAYNWNDTQSYVANGYHPSNAAADAANIWSQVHPFATLDEFGLEPDTFSHFFAGKGVGEFGQPSYTAANASAYPGLYWSFQPSPERRAQEYATYVCTKIFKPGKTTFAGSFAPGTSRTYGALLSDDTERPDARQLGDLAMADIKQTCGLVPADTKYFRYTGSSNATGPKNGWGVQNMATFKGENITTILWPGGLEGEDLTAADKVQYYPEWVVLGDGETDGNSSMGVQPKNATAHVLTVGPVTLINTNGLAIEKACYDAFREVDPTVPTTDYQYACTDIHNGGLFDSVRQLFIGAQLAGPILNPDHMSQGFHAIPAKPSTSPYQPSCFYDPGDYTCVKDAVAEFFDPNTPCGTGETTSTGCYRMWRGGQRFLPGQWPAGDAADGRSLTDVLNLYDPGPSPQVRPPSS